jgi:hypothetical protein
MRKGFSFAVLVLAPVAFFGCQSGSADGGDGNGGSDGGNTGACVDGGNCPDLICCKLHECQVPLGACQNSLAAACRSGSDSRALSGVTACIDAIHCSVSDCVTDAGGTCHVSGCLVDAGLSSACSAAVAAQLALVPLLPGGPGPGGSFCAPTDYTCMDSSQCCTGICIYSDAIVEGVCTRPDGGCSP